MTLRKDKMQGGRTLARKRRAVGLTQHDVARLTGISPNRIAFAETDRLILLPSELDSIRAVLKERARTVQREMSCA